MYHLLIEPVFGEEVQLGLPRARDAQLCIQLAAERNNPKLIPPLLFSAGRANLQLDYLSIQNSPGKLCSQKFIYLLEKADVSFTAYPTKLLDKESEQLCTASYYFFLPQWLEGAIDWANSEEWINEETGVRQLTHLLLTESCLEASPLLFQTRERGYYLIHEKLRIKLQEEAITGVAFAPLDTVYLPHEGLKRVEIERSLVAYPDDWKLWLDLGQTSILLHRNQDALDALDRVLALKPDMGEAWLRRGNILYIQGQFQDALVALQQATQLEPENMRAWVVYCSILCTLEEYQEALKIAEYLVKRWDTDSLTWHKLAITYMGLNRYHDALGAIEQGLRSGTSGGRTHWAEMYKLKGETLTHLGRYEEAGEVYTIGISFYPRLRALWAGKAYALRNLGKDDEARMAEEELLRLEQKRQENLQKKPM